MVACVCPQCDKLIEAPSRKYPGYCSSDHASEYRRRWRKQRADRRMRKRPRPVPGEEEINTSGLYFS